MAPLKVYVASVTANPEIRKRVLRTLMLLDGLGIPFDSIDITKPEKAEERRFMRENATKEGQRGPPLPPQFFYNEEYLGNYEDFDASVESDTITEFLRLLPDTIRKRIRVATAKNPPSVAPDHPVASESNVASDLHTNEETEKPVASVEKPQKENAAADNGLDLEDEDEEWDEDEEESEESKTTADQKTPSSDKPNENEEVEESAVIQLKPKEKDEDVENEDEAFDEDEEYDEDEEEEA
ncbi:unnamed protein product [Caenorhabditis auriculariae]|uniref:Glutaredoxin domain-containing protein n=1 Tax=Caenorhabditis auriculariae TaxID=2777116 RepID=A0A8S1GP04_9PELO|nr:unnamed protein product [Caenorhabditis auriculariae]